MHAYTCKHAAHLDQTENQLLPFINTASEDKTADLAVENHVRYAALLNSETAAQRADFLYSYLPDSSPCALLWTESGNTYTLMYRYEVCVYAR